MNLGERRVKRMAAMGKDARGQEEQYIRDVMERWLLRSLPRDCIHGPVTVRFHDDWRTDAAAVYASVRIVRDVLPEDREGLLELLNRPPTSTTFPGLGLYRVRDATTSG